MINTSEITEFGFFLGPQIQKEIEKKVALFLEIVQSSR
jgi:hypothetical protein